MPIAFFAFFISLKLNQTGLSEEEEEKMAGGIRGRESATKSMKSALVVVCALAFGWLNTQLVFKPFLDRTRDAIETADPDARESHTSPPSDSYISQGER
ncbi:outer envelope membrane protein 7 [Cinnamomum micranthum f. kanehirae]|uniref:Outer envelope membrane protein 7 n=1 Tax=Cinnamomum micranthum f. kanehirae TaxID=337451 RepID=A0A3S4NXE7_9MAGN|nr:outer envelope membrane protein 7 [Cinnamomum micranthum f. kanehirae]